MIKKTIVKRIIFLTLLIGGIFIFRLVLAQDLGLGMLDNNFGGVLGESGSDPREIIGRIINIILGFLGLIAISLTLYAGFIWMTSNGEEDKITRAKKILKSGAIGLLIILSAWIIVAFVINKIGNGGSGSDPISGFCFNGEVRSCGCNGISTCVNGSWGGCIGDRPEDCLDLSNECDGGSLPGCQANNNLCSTGYFCNDACICQPKAEIGESCDGNKDNSTCEADNNLCADYLTCDPGSCLCFGSPVITGISPAGGFCNSDVNKSCESNEDCSSGDTCNQDVANGTVNNFITISGHNFGEYSEENSRILFSGPSSEIEAVNPKEVNKACVNSWRNDQVIIAIPENTKTGPIKIVNSEGLIDSSDDSYGPQLPDFISNNISRPGLCALDPVEGTLNKKVSYQGINLYSGSAYFGNYSDNISGLYSDFEDETGLSGSASVPNIKSGRSGSFVEREVTGVMQKSNYLKFVKEREEADGPYIMSISPSEGAPGQYITITGAGFGGARGNNKVHFVDGANKIEASYSFPAICINSVWSDKQIIVKAPDSLADDSYYLEITIGNKIISSQNANPNTFKLNSLLPLFPSICKMDPVKGPIGTPVTFWGEYFGSKKSTILAKFNFEKSSLGEVDSKNKVDETTANVPLEASTGPVKLVQDNKNSNELNFLVAECLSDAECGDQVCCPQNTYKKGRCVAELNDCFLDIPTSVFEWRFSSNFSTTINSDLSSCLGFSKNFGACYQGLMCPNSPGSCSSPSTSFTKTVGTCNITCNDVPGCTAATCDYNEDLDKCVLKTTNIVSDCDPGELIAPAKNSNLNIDKNIPRIMAWQGRINQHWNLSAGLWESDIDGKSGAEKLNTEAGKLAYCQKFYPTTVRTEPYKNEESSSWNSARSRKFDYSIKMSYRCILDTDANNLDLAGVKKVCNQNNKWEIKINSSCPTGWTMGVNNTCTQDAVECNSCPTNLSCEKNNLFNICVSEKLCQDSQAKCVDNTVNDKDDCILTVEPGCDCCCRIGFSEQDCCAPLTCGGTCGSDLTANTNTYGSCSGCAAVGTDQETQDDACNCLGTSGKFCSITSETPQGICVDCSSLTTQESCGDHPSTCCFDSNKTATTTDDFCRSVGETEVISKDKNSPNYGYCGYFSCDDENPLICSGLLTKTGKYNKLKECNEGCPKNGDDCNRFNEDKTSCLAEPGCCYDAKAIDENVCTSGKKISSGENNGYCAYYDCFDPSEGDPYECNRTAVTTGKYKDIRDCSAGCPNPSSGPGLKCQVTAENDLTFGKCNFNLCNFSGFKCLQDDGLTAVSESYPECGTCCCQPATETTTDSCISPETPDLYCEANQGNCTGANRGLCCGCSKDSDCGDEKTVGCGSSTCCENRPNVVTTSPAAAETDVCRNSAIKVTFNTVMDTSSFSDNFLVFEERSYGDGTCPAGTFVSQADLIGGNKLAQNKGFIVRWWNNLTQQLTKLFNKNKVLATPPNNDKLYCSVEGIINFTNEEAKTNLIFTPKKILSASTKYFILLKGDETLTSKTGILSASKIGLNEKGFKNSPTEFIKEVSFNGRKYINSYSWQFTTLSNQGPRNGICDIEYVKINPSSYLFKTTVNDLTENDVDILSSSFDTVRDGDKLFTAAAYSSDNQILFPVAGYNWDWTWGVNNNKVVEIKSKTDWPDTSKLIVANPKVTDGQAQVKAMINMDAYRIDCGSNCNSFPIGDKVAGLSDVYVFVCENPWPAVKSDGTWSPWQDSSGNCSDDGSCDDFNYKFYYCRDAGQPGTFDDLPVINYSPVSLSGNLVCSSNKKPCSNAGDSCGEDGEASGVCVWEILKESYFFRDEVLSGIELTSVNDTQVGGEVELKWKSAREKIGAYKIYYLQSGQGTMLSKEIKPVEACQVDSSGNNYTCSAKIGGLVNGVSYVFKISLISNTKTESLFSNEKTIMSSDKTPPSVPLNLDFEATLTEIKFSWDGSVDSNDSYRLYYGINSGQYAESLDTTPGVRDLTLLLSRFPDNKYYFSVSAFDKARNESAKSSEIMVAIDDNKISRYVVHDGKNWRRVSNISDMSNNSDCLVKMDTDPTNSGRAICNDNLNFTNPAWFSGKIQRTKSYICYVPGCERLKEPNICFSYGNKKLTNNCYVLAE